MANAPAEATYWLETTNSSLPNAVALTSLGANGLVKVNATTGAPALATPDVDYMSASAELLSIRDLNPQSGSLLVAQSNESWGLLNPPSGSNKAVVWNGSSIGYQTIPLITYPYLTVAPTSGLTSSRVLDAINGITINDGGALGNFTIQPTSKLASLQGLTTPGIVCISDVNTSLTRTIVSAAGSIDITNASGVAGNINLETVDDKSLQQVHLSVSGSVIAQRSNINLIPGSGMGITAVDNGSSNRVDVTFTSNGGGGGGGNNANVVTLTNQTSIYPNSFNLSALSTGLLKVTTTTGNLTTAVSGTDYLAPSANLTSLSSASNTIGNLYVGNGSGISALPLGSSGYVLTSQAGNVAWVASPSATNWAQYAATQNVNIAGFNLNTVNTISNQKTRIYNPSDATSYYDLTWNTTTAQIQKTTAGVAGSTGLIYDTVINPPPSVEPPQMNFTVTGFGPGPSVAPFGPTVAAPATGYYNMLFTIKFRSQDTGITIETPSFILFAIRQVGGNIISSVIWNCANLFQITNPDDNNVYTYTIPFNNLNGSPSPTPLMEGFNYQMAAATNADSYDWGGNTTVSLNCIFIGSA